jgi:amino acid transporter
MENKNVKKFNTFGGVFTPDVLTILGVIMYLRLGWVVGNAGFIGAVAIILLAKVVTICTGLSMSSITTNIRIGAGGAYSIISKSLGLEAGGSVGIPFYISQTLSAALYIIGFTEGWLGIFPDHPPMFVALLTWTMLFVITSISAHFAIRIQYVIMAIIVLSIISFLMTPAPRVAHVQMIGNFPEADFWHVFAIFFPAVTGIMAGANMSGDLKDPRRAIPIGTMSAISVTMIIYIGLAYVLASIATPEELIANQLIMVEKARFKLLVLWGILAATFSSALGSMVGAPRILQALAEHNTVPFSRFFAQKSANNEPRNANFVTSGIIAVAILLGNLNALASLITMFFLITYGTLNLVVFIQQSMKIISFRPTFKIPRIVPLTGALSCIFIMFLINPVFSIVAIFTIIVLYIWLARKGLKAEWGDIRGGMFLRLAEQASRIAARYPRHQISWKPDLLIPIDDPRVWSGSLLFIKNIFLPAGSIFAFTVTPRKPEEIEKALNELLKPLKSTKNALVNATVIEDDDFVHGTKIVMQTLKGSNFRPNSLLMTFSDDNKNDKALRELIRQAFCSGMGVMLLYQHPRVAFGVQRDINLWLRDGSPNWHLALLLALQIHLNWNGKLNLITVTQDKSKTKKLREFLINLSDQARLPSITEFYVLEGEFFNVLEKAPRADINIFGLAEKLSFDFMRKVAHTINTSCMFVGDSGSEDALA